MKKINNDSENTNLWEMIKQNNDIFVFSKGNPLQIAIFLQNRQFHRNVLIKKEAKSKTNVFKSNSN